jgi:hypothetical protein
MWKIAVGFILFASLALFIIFKAGDKVDMQGETGNITETKEESAPTPPALPSNLPAVETAASTASK